MGPLASLQCRTNLGGGKQLEPVKFNRNDGCLDALAFFGGWALILLLVFVGVPLGLVYLVVRFIKWAWG